MSDETKRPPFAEVRQAPDDERFEVFVDGHPIVLWSRETADFIAANLCRAVEQREANLVGALRGARPYVVNASERMYDGSQGHQMRTEAARRIAVIDAALAGRGNYVRAELLAEANEKLRQIMVACDLLDRRDRSITIATVCERLDAAGLTERKPSEWTDEEVIDRWNEAEKERHRRTLG